MSIVERMAKTRLKPKNCYLCGTNLDDGHTRAWRVDEGKYACTDCYWQGI